MVKINKTSAKPILFRPKTYDCVRPFKRNSKTIKKQKNYKLFDNKTTQNNYSMFDNYDTDTNNEILSNDPFMGVPNADLYLDENNNNLNQIEIELDGLDLYLDDPFLDQLHFDVFVIFLDNNLAIAG